MEYSFRFGLGSLRNTSQEVQLSSGKFPTGYVQIRNVVLPVSTNTHYDQSIGITFGSLLPADSLLDSYTRTRIHAISTESP
jgi:hypothetical protein